MAEDCHAGPGERVLKEVSDRLWLDARWLFPAPSQFGRYTDTGGRLEHQKWGEGPFSAHQCQAFHWHQAASEQELETPQAGPARKVPGSANPI